MKALSHASQVALGPEPHRLTIMLPLGQDIRNMCFSKEQQNAVAARRKIQKLHKPPPPDSKPPTEPSTLRSVKSTDTLPQRNAVSRLGSASNRSSPRINSRKSSSQQSREFYWHEMEIPSELEAVRNDTPEEIRNIIQESMDEQRAARASRMAQPQAIVVRTTITQSSRERDGMQIPRTEISATASVSSRRAESAESSLSGDMSSSWSLGLESTTSLGSSEGEITLLKACTIHHDDTIQGSRENLGPTYTSSLTCRRCEKPLQGHDVLNLLRGRKSEEIDHEEKGKAYQRIDEWDLMLPHEKKIENKDSGGHRYYCASPSCVKWIDVSSALAYDGALRCPHCGTSICSIGNFKKEEGVTVRNKQSREAIMPSRVTEHSTSRRCEADEELLAEEAQQITAREYERLEGVTEFFEHLRATLEQVRSQQRQAIEERHNTDLEKAERKEAELICGEKILDRDQRVSSERADLVKKNQDALKALRKSHALHLMETVRRHRNDQDTFIARCNTEMETNIHFDQAGALEMLLQAQENERITLRSQQNREIQKWQKRGPRLVEAFDAKIEAERLQMVKAQVKEAEEVTRLSTGVRRQIDADWKWFNAIFLDRAMMLGDDERRMILSGTHAPKPPYSR